MWKCQFFPQTKIKPTDCWFRYKWAHATCHLSRVRVKAGTENSPDAQGFMEGLCPTRKRSAPSATHSFTRLIAAHTPCVAGSVPDSNVTETCGESVLDRKYLPVIPPEQDQNTFPRQTAQMHLFHLQQAVMGLSPFQRQPHLQGVYFILLSMAIIS